MRVYMRVYQSKVYERERCITCVCTWGCINLKCMKERGVSHVCVHERRVWKKDVYERETNINLKCMNLKRRIPWNKSEQHKHRPCKPSICICCSVLLHGIRLFWLIHFSRLIHVSLVAQSCPMSRVYPANLVYFWSLRLWHMCLSFSDICVSLSLTVLVYV